MAARRLGANARPGEPFVPSSPPSYHSPLSLFCPPPIQTRQPSIPRREEAVITQQATIDFYRLAKERIPYPTQRYLGETERLYGILDSRLADADYIVGNKYSIADIACFGWVNIAYFSGVDLRQFEHLHAWWQRVSERPAVKKGLLVPSESQIINSSYQRRLREEEGFMKEEDRLAELGLRAKEDYGYKYSSP